MPENPFIQFFRPPGGETAEREAVPPVPYRWAPVVFLGLLLSILLVTWPWATTLSTEFLEHWDPPFHAWKLELMARGILAGRLLPVDGNTNMLYPHSGALYHEALQWPQALVAAPFFALPHANPILIYHGVLLAFWTLSGVCLWMLLLALGTTRRAALLGALFFTLMPYSVSYMVEFNMKLNFGLPLFFFFAVRYVQRPSIRYACGMALAWWLQAASELYQAVFLLLLLPLVGLPVLAVHFRLIGSGRKFWLPAGCAGLLGGALTWAFLMPYLTLLDAGSIQRLLREIQNHSLEPLSYFCSLGRFRLWSAPVDWFDEMVVYPTAAMLLLTGLFSAQTALARRRMGPWGLGGWARAVRNVSLGLFAVLTFAIYHSGGSAWFAPAYPVLPVLAVGAAVVAAGFPVRRDLPSLFLGGLFAAAVLAFFLSLGPRLAILKYTAPFAAKNHVYLWLYAHVDALRGFRVVSRFSVFPLLFMCVASAFAWARLERRWLHRPWLRALWILPVALLALEAVPARIQTRPLQLPYASPVLDALDRMEQPHVLAVVPMADRYYTSRHMLQIGRHDRLFAYGWGGAFPKNAKKLEASLHPGRERPARAAALLRPLWPECLVLEDKHLSRGAVTGLTCNYTQLLADETELVQEDERFALLRFKPNPGPAVEEIRLIRADFLRENPVVHFRARLDGDGPPAELYLDVNGHLVGRVALTSETRDFRLRVPRSHVITLLPNRLRFHARDDRPFRLESFGAAADSGEIPSESSAAADCPPWVGHLHHVPPTAQRLDVAYGNALGILACDMPETTVAPGDSLPLRFYFQCRWPLKTLRQRNLAVRLYPAAGRWIEEEYPLAHATVDLHDYLCQRPWDRQANPCIYVADVTVRIPADLPAGEYAPFVLAKKTSGAALKGTQRGKGGKRFALPGTVRVRAEGSLRPAPGPDGE